MSVTVDRQPLPAAELGLNTVGQVLAHLQKPDRLVVHMLIDGEEPNLADIGVVRQISLTGRTVYIETADPRKLAGDVLNGAEEQLSEADQLKMEASELLQQGQTAAAMQKLSACFTIWQHAQESILKTTQLLRIDLDEIEVDGQPLGDMLEQFVENLHSIRSALEQRDFVLLNDVLLYETTQTAVQWSAALQSVRQAIESLH